MTDYSQLPDDMREKQTPMLERIVGPDRVRFSKYVLYGAGVTWLVSMLYLLATGGG